MRRRERIDVETLGHGLLLDDVGHLVTELLHPLLQDVRSLFGGPVGGVDLVGITPVFVEVLFSHQLHGRL